MVRSYSSAGPDNCFMFVYVRRKENVFVCSQDHGQFIDNRNISVGDCGENGNNVSLQLRGELVSQHLQFVLLLRILAPHPTYSLFMCKCVFACDGNISHNFYFSHTKWGISYRRCYRLKLIEGADIFKCHMCYDPSLFRKVVTISRSTTKIK